MYPGLAAAGLRWNADQAVAASMLLARRYYDDSGLRFAAKVRAGLFLTYVARSSRR